MGRDDSIEWPIVQKNNGGILQATRSDVNL
jgi:hypothetical protein